MEKSCIVKESVSESESESESSNRNRNKPLHPVPSRCTGWSTPGSCGWSSSLRRWDGSTRLSGRISPSESPRSTTEGRSTRVSGAPCCYLLPLGLVQSLLSAPLTFLSPCVSSTTVLNSFSPFLNCEKKTFKMTAVPQASEVFLVLWICLLLCGLYSEEYNGYLMVLVVL